MTQKCFNGHDVVYQPFSGGKEWWCEICQSDGPYDYESIPPEERPRAWLLTQPNGVEELKKQMPNVDKTNEQEPTEGPKSASGVSSELANPEKSTNGRLLDLEAKFSGNVWIYSGDVGELIVVAYGYDTRVLLHSVITGKINTHQDYVIQAVDHAVNSLRLKDEARRKWEEWLRTQGWS